MDRIRLGMVGGGRGAFIGAVHRIAARLDHQYELIAGALSADPLTAQRSGEDLGLASDRAYTSYERMAAAEAARSDGIEAVAIVTPNHNHAAVARAFLLRGIHVICDKPLAISVEEAEELAGLAKKSGRLLAVTYNYTGYPLVREAREMCALGLLGKIRLVQVEYLQDWLTERVEASGSKQAEWRTNPSRAGRGGAIADIGTHAYHLVRFITGLTVTSLCAELTSFVEGRRVDDDARLLLRFAGGAKGLLWVSQVAPGNENGLAIRIYGEKGGLEWRQVEPNQLCFSPLGLPRQMITRGGTGVHAAAARVTRIPAGHPEGYLEAFATIYSEIGAAIRAARAGGLPAPEVLFPHADDGLDGLHFLQATFQSHDAGCTWHSLNEPQPAVR
jgi:predicted dehydrogenase